MNFNDIAKHSDSEDKARAFPEAERWPKGAICPHCGVEGESYKLTAKPDSKHPASWILEGTIAVAKKVRVNRRLTLSPLGFKEAVSDLLKIKPEPKQKPKPEAKRKAK